MMIESRPILTAIIPYFQRKPGLLAACVKSILSQKGPFELKVLITDDESPLPASEELRSIACDPAQITVLRQKNGGPGSARNRCLDNLPPGTTYVALMDSDDAWEEGFLDAAVDALERGYDLFFANTRRYARPKTRFDWNPNPALNLDAAQHKLLDATKSLYEFSGDFFDFLVRRSNILSGSATVYRLSVAPELRFREQFFNGQDRVFKLELGQHLGKAAFSPTVFCVEGAGVNIFDSANWGLPRSIALLSSYIEMSKFVLRTVPLNAAQAKFVRGQLSRSRHSFAANLLHLLVRRDAIDYEVVKRTFRADPMTMLLLAPNLAKATLRKLTGGAG